MSARRFYSPETAIEVSNESFAPLNEGYARPPQVFFKVVATRNDVMEARPPGAYVRCEIDADGRSLVTVRSASAQEHVATVTVHVPAGGDLTEEAIAIASALYWSWWRAEDMRGVTHKADRPTASEGGS